MFMLWRSGRSLLGKHVFGECFPGAIYLFVVIELSHECGISEQQLLCANPGIARCWISHKLQCSSDVEWLMCCAVANMSGEQKENGSAVVVVLIA